MKGPDDQDLGQTERLLRVLAEQLKTPLLQIAQVAELGQEDGLQQAGETAEHALKLVDSFVLATELNQQQLQLEPVSIPSVLYDVAVMLRPLAEQHNCELELRLDGKYKPVMADRQSLQAALVSLGQSFIEVGSDKRSTITLAAYKSPNGISTGLFAEGALSTDTFKRALKLYGLARQAMPKLQTAAGAGLYVAEALFAAMAAPLEVTKHHNLNGLAATFVPSAQLRLI